MRIERDVFPGNASLQFIGQVIKVNGKAYNINEDAVDKVEELFSQEDFGEVVERHVGDHEHR